MNAIALPLFSPEAFVSNTWTHFRIFLASRPLLIGYSDHDIHLCVIRGQEADGQVSTELEEGTERRSFWSTKIDISKTWVGCGRVTAHGPWIVRPGAPRWALRFVLSAVCAPNSPLRWSVVRTCMEGFHSRDLISYVNLFRLPQQSTTGWATSTADVYFLTVLKAGSRCHRLLSPEVSLPEV